MVINKNVIVEVANSEVALSAILSGSDFSVFCIYPGQNIFGNFADLNFVM